MKRAILLIWLLASFTTVLCSIPAQAQEFSADIILRSPRENEPVAKIYVSKGRIRIDTPQPHAGSYWYDHGQFHTTFKTLDDEPSNFPSVAMVGLSFQPANNSSLCKQWFSHLDQLAKIDQLDAPELQGFNQQISCEDLGEVEFHARKARKFSFHAKDQGCANRHPVDR